MGTPFTATPTMPSCAGSSSFRDLMVVGLFGILNRRSFLTGVYNGTDGTLCILRFALIAAIRRLPIPTPSGIPSEKSVEPAAATVHAETSPSHWKLSVAGGNTDAGEHVSSPSSSPPKQTFSPKLAQTPPLASITGFPQASNQGKPQGSRRGLPHASKQHCVTGLPQASTTGLPHPSMHSLMSFVATCSEGQASPEYPEVGFPHAS
mmetsp:Transcript_76507/g.115148  ORF Transcript_76507/g.115148 Transcript_76507/m.115148 type:complete len:206 (+) Transcript_76507:1387-2004(+)